MPDQSSASKEHALIQEITAPMASLPDDALPLVAEADFPVVLRGYDRIAVDAYVRKTSQLVAEMQATRSPEAAVRRALERVGEEISGILQRAHDTAGEITRQSRREAEDRLEVSRAEAREITRAAEQRLRELDADTDRIWAERERIVEDARALARQLSAIADSAAARFPSAEPAPEAEPELAPGSGSEPEGEPEAVEQPGAVEQPEAVEPQPEAVEPGAYAPERGGDPSDPDTGATAVLPPGRGPEPDPDATATFPAVRADDDPGDADL